MEHNPHAVKWGWVAKADEIIEDTNVSLAVRARYAWARWLASLADWKYFVTITFDDAKFLRRGYNRTWDKIGQRTASKSWVELLMSAYGGIGVDVLSGEQRETDQISWVRAMEYQKLRGVPHIHGLLNASVKSSSGEMKRFCDTYFGYSSVVDFNSEAGGALYLSKYVAKEMGDIQWSINGKHYRSNDGYGEVKELRYDDPNGIRELLTKSRVRG